MKKQKVKAWFIPENIYQVPINLLVSTDKKAVVEWLEKNYHKGEESDYAFLSDSANGHFLWEKGNRQVVIWIKDPNDIPCLSHEIIHYVIAVLEHRGVPLTEHCSEAFTYFHQSILTHAMLALGHQKLCGKNIL